MEEISKKEKQEVVKKYDYEKVKQATKLFLEGIGEDVNREGLKETPDRVARMYETVMNGYDIDPKKYLKIFESNTDDMVVVEGPIYSYCEHHVALFHGKITIAYIPNGKVIGISKLIRIARVYAKRVQIQERLTKQIADFLEENLSPQGIAIHISAEHTCMSIRGVRTPGAKTRTTRLTGLFKTDPATRQEFMSYIT